MLQSPSTSFAVLGFSTLQKGQLRRFHKISNMSTPDEIFLQNSTALWKIYIYLFIYLFTGRRLDNVLMKCTSLDLLLFYS